MNFLGAIFRNLSLGRILVLVILWFFVLQPLLLGTYNRFVAYYYWMRP